MSAAWEISEWWGFQGAARSGRSRAACEGVGAACTYTGGLDADGRQLSIALSESGWLDEDRPGGSPEPATQVRCARSS